MTAYFASRRDMSRGKDKDRFGMQIFGSDGVIEAMGNYMGSVKYLPDPAWSPGRTNAAWQDVSSAGIGEPEPISKVAHIERNRVPILDLLAAVREDREPLSGMYEARDTLEMTHGVFESHRLKKPVPLPLVNRRHPLEIL